MKKYPYWKHIKCTRAQALTVDCPQCGARQGSPCKGSRNRERTSVHATRQSTYVSQAPVSV